MSTDTKMTPKQAHETVSDLFHEHGDGEDDVTADEMISEEGAALDVLADFLYADPHRFPSGADVCEVLDQQLRRTGREPRSTEPVRWLITETTEQTVMATTEEEALAIWLDKGDEAAQFIGVTGRQVEEADR